MKAKNFIHLTIVCLVAMYSLATQAQSADQLTMKVTIAVEGMMKSKSGAT